MKEEGGRRRGRRGGGMEGWKGEKHETFSKLDLCESGSV